jgi:hypothetical protein
MIEYLEFNKIDVVAAKVSAKVTKAEFDNLKKEITEKINRYGKINWYYEMTNFDGWDLKAFISDFSFTLKNTTNFKRIAFVGEKFLEKLMAEISNLFTPAEVRYFNSSNREAAIEWINYGIIKKEE